MKLEKKRNPFKRNLFWIFLLLLILYVGLHLLARTEGMRGYVAEKVSEGTGQKVTLEQCSFTPLLSLQLYGLAFEGVLAPDVKIRFSPSAIFYRDRPFVKKLKLKGAQVTFGPASLHAAWNPLVLNTFGNRLGAALGAGSLSAAPSAALPQFPPRWINDQTALELSEAKLIWNDANGLETAYLIELDAHVTTAQLRNRSALQFGVTCGRAKLASGAQLDGLRFEAVKFGGYQPVIVLAFSDRSGDYEGFQSEIIWQDLKLHLEALGKL